MHKNSQQSPYGESDMYSLTLVAMTPRLPLAASVISHQTPRGLPRKAVSYRRCGAQPGQKSGQPTSRNVPCSQPPPQGQPFTPSVRKHQLRILSYGLLCADTVEKVDSLVIMKQNWAAEFDYNNRGGGHEFFIGHSLALPA